MTVVGVYVTQIFEKHGLASIPGIQSIDGIAVYPVEYFCPLDAYSKKLRIKYI